VNRIDATRKLSMRIRNVLTTLEKNSTWVSYDL
jgi:hypothetical protein